MTDNNNIRKKKDNSSLKRVLKYSGMRLIALVITVIIGVYLTILIANMGGYVDELQKGQVNDRITQEAAKDPSVRQMTPDARKEYIETKKRIGI